MLNQTEKPCFGPGHCVYRTLTTVPEVQAIQDDAHEWYVASASFWTVQVYRAKTAAERVGDPHLALTEGSGA